MDRSEGDAVLASVREALGEHGFEIERIEREDDAVIVQYATIVGEVAEIEETLATDIPKTVGTFRGALGAHGTETGVTSTETSGPSCRRMIVLAVNARTEPAERTGKLRWEIDRRWLPEERDVTLETYAEPLEKVLSTAVVIDEAGTHEVDTAFDFEDR